MTLPSKQPEVILDVAGEGGGYTILGELQEGKWRFWRDAGGSDAWLLDDDDADTPVPLPVESAPEPIISYFHTLDEALETINSCWPHLSPIQIHPDFAEDIWHKAVGYWSENEDKSRTRHVLPRWSEICLGRQITRLDRIDRVGDVSPDKRRGKGKF